jgi:hypothetical protein
MNDMQNIQSVQQQAYDVAVHFKLLAYSTYAAIILCAIFSVLIFWKLCQIQKLLAANSPGEQANPFLPSASSIAPATPPSYSPPPPDDSRYLPKS